jgi:hypothetical protein
MGIYAYIFYGFTFFVGTDAMHDGVLLGYSHIEETQTEKQ